MTINAGTPDVQCLGQALDALFAHVNVAPIDAIVADLGADQIAIELGASRGQPSHIPDVVVADLARVELCCSALVVPQRCREAA